LSVQLVSKISNLCDPNPPFQTDSRQTDGQTDDMQSQYRALRYSAARGKKTYKDNSSSCFDILQHCSNYYDTSQ